MTIRIKQLLSLLVLLPLAALAQHAPVGIATLQDSTKSIQFGLISNIATDGGKGLQLSGFSNMSATPFRGIQLSGVSNISRGLPKGIQLAALLNVSSYYMRGLQLASANYADSLNGSQVGLVNIARTHPKGWQVGVVNITHDTIAHKLGLVNINPTTTIDHMISVGTASKVNVGIRFRNRSTYSMIGMGTHFMGLDEKFSGALYYRLGQYFQVTPRLSFSGDLGFYHIETFEQHSADTPERLFSIQAHLNADYLLGKNVGAFASVGWGTTRYYQNGKSYRNRPLFEAGITIRQQRSQHSALSQRFDAYEPMAADSLMALPLPQRPWTAEAEAAGVNVFVHCLDRFILNKDYANTTMHSLRRNFEKGFVWDNDEFMTNNFGHPYHGNLYFNSARSNGLSFWQSAPYALGGSLMWEFLGETEPPALNDVFATTMGGICIGEITHRASNIFLNDRTTGMNRFLREAAATIVNPIKGLNRIISGDAWRVRHRNYLYHDRNRLPIDASATIAFRYLADEGALFRGENNPIVNLYMEYGNAINNEGDSQPYDFFDAEATFGLSSNQPVVNAIHLLGRLWSTPVFDNKNAMGEFGIYQHFNYYNSMPVKDGSDQTPYRIGETASIGPGIIFALPRVSALTRLEQRVFLSGIILGGTKSDYYSFQERDYNMGSGFSVKTKTHLEFERLGRLILHAKYFRIFTWKGYEQKDLSNVNLSYLNAQGDKGNATLLVVNPIVEIDLKKQWSINFSNTYFYRRTHYKYHHNVTAKTFEIRTGVTYHF